MGYTVRLEIRDEKNEVQYLYEGPLENPAEMKTPADRPFRTKKYLIFGYSFQPRVKALLGGE